MVPAEGNMHGNRPCCDMMQHTLANVGALHRHIFATLASTIVRETIFSVRGCCTGQHFEFMALSVHSQNNDAVSSRPWVIVKAASSDIEGLALSV